MTNDTANNKKLLEQKANSLHRLRKQVQMHRNQNVEAWTEKGE